MITKNPTIGDKFKITSTDFIYTVIEVYKDGSIFTIDNLGDYNTFGLNYLNQSFLTYL